MGAALEDFITRHGERVGPRQLAALAQLDESAPRPGSSPTPLPATPSPSPSSPSGPATPRPSSPSGLSSPGAKADPFQTFGAPVATATPRPSSPSAHSPPRGAAKADPFETFGAPVAPSTRPSSPSGQSPPRGAAKANPFAAFGVPVAPPSSKAQGPAVPPSSSSPRPAAPSPLFDELFSDLVEDLDEPIAPKAPAAEPLRSPPDPFRVPVAARLPVPAEPLRSPPDPFPVAEPLRSPPQPFPVPRANEPLRPPPEPFPVPRAAEPPRPPPPPAAPRPPRTEAEVRAAALLADATGMRLHDAGALLGTPAELEHVRTELERDEGLHLLARFPRHASRLLKALENEALVFARVAGAVEGLLLAEAYGALATMLEHLHSRAAADPLERKVFEVAQATLATAGRATRLSKVLREAAPSDAEGLGRLLPFFGAPHAALWLTLFESIELARQP